MRLGVLRRRGRETTVDTSVWKMRLIGFALLLAAVGCAALAVFATDAGTLRRVIFALSVPVFAFAAFLAFVIWRGGTTSLISVTDEGLELPIGFLGWDE